MKRLLDKVQHLIWKHQHHQLQKKLRARFASPPPTILSCNCLGGVLYHDLGLQFTSPTINLYMNNPDFIRFLENLEHYLTLPIIPYNGQIERNYPIGQLGDLTLFLVHYPTVEEANDKWQQRKARMDRENIFILATDRDGFTPELLQRFNNLPYPHKKLFTHQYINNPDCVYIRGFEKEGAVGSLIAAQKGGKRVINGWVA